MFRELVVRNRSCRRYVQSVQVSRQTLRELVDLARLSASGGNLQPLRYILSNEPARNALIFKHLAWAAYLPDWKGPAKSERPAAYILILHDTCTSKTAGCDHGIAAQTILLGAVEKGLGGCIIGSVDHSGLQRALNIPRTLEILLVLALGKPGETVQLETAGANDSLRYWRDAKGVHHVPKRRLQDIILGS